MIAIDVGQSGSRVRCDGVEIILERGKLAGEDILTTIRNISESIPEFRSETVSLSLTGFAGEVSNPVPFHDICAEVFGSKETAVIDDGLASFAGALQGQVGVVLAIGGGVVAVAGKDNNFSHVDGLGSTFGDEGAGFWLGSRAISRALATREGRDDKVALLEKFQDEVNAYDNLIVKNSSDAVLLAIESARKLLECADQKIPGAVEIRDEGARLLGKTIIAAWKNVGGLSSEYPNLCITGGLAKNRNYTELISRQVCQEIAGARTVSSKGNNLDGAVWIAENLREDLSPMLRWARSTTL